MTPIKPVLLCTASLLALAGCAAAVPGGAEYSCSGRPDGVVCASASDMHRMTDDRDRVHEADLAAMAAPPAEGGVREGRIDISAPVPTVPSGPAPLLVNAPFTPVEPDAGGDRLRIWIAPWRDADGDVRAPGYIYADLRAAGGRDHGNLLQTPEMIEARTGPVDPLGLPRAGTPLEPPRGGAAPRRAQPRASPPPTIEVSS